MFFQQRATEAEYFDHPGRTLADVEEGYRELARVNRLFHFAEPFQRLLPAELGEPACRELSILDLGAGDGSLGEKLESWADLKGWEWPVTHLDINPLALSLSKSPRRVVASALDIPFADNSFDVVIAAQMTHHLEFPQGVEQHFREAYRVARKMVVIYDLHRSLTMYALIWMTLIGLRCPNHFRADGLLSVKKGWRTREWLDLAQKAGVPGAKVWLDHGARVIMQVVKPQKP